MQAIEVFSDEWFFQLVVVMIYFGGFCLALCLMELAVCLYAEWQGQDSGLPTQQDIRRLKLWLRRRRRRKVKRSSRNTYYL